MVSFRFYLITDRTQGRHDPLAVLPALAAAGLRALQIREKDLAPAALADYCRELAVCLETGSTAGRSPLQFYLNDRADIALSLGLAGVHLRESSLPLEQHAETLRGRLAYGVSTHDLAGVRKASAAGAAFATFGPVFTTASKAAYGDPLGLKALEEAAAATSLPLYALGGITPDRVADCIAAGASGVAAISAIWNAEHPVAALGQFETALGGL